MGAGVGNNFGGTSAGGGFNMGNNEWTGLGQQ